MLKKSKETITKINDHTYEYENIVIGSRLNAVMYAFLNNYPLLLSNYEPPLPFELFPHDVNLDNFNVNKAEINLTTTNGIEKFGNPKSELWKRLCYSLSLSGLMPLSNNASSMRIEDDVLKVYISNTKLLDNKGWTGLLIEPSNAYDELIINRKNDICVNALISDKELYPVIQKIRYPKAGEINPTFKIGIVRAKGGGRRWLDLGEINEHYFPWMEWISDKRVAFLKMGRKQKNQILMVAEKETGKSNTIFMESDLNGWLDNHGQFWFLTDGRIIWLSEQSGYKHIHMAKHSGSKSWSITRGEWEVNTIKYIDEKNEMIYFTSNKESVFETRFYSIRFDGTDLLLLTPEQGCHDILITGAGNYFIDYYSSMMLPNRILLKNLKSGELIKVLDETDLNQSKVIIAKKKETNDQEKPGNHLLKLHFITKIGQRK